MPHHNHHQPTTCGIDRAHRKFPISLESASGSCPGIPLGILFAWICRSRSFTSGLESRLFNRGVTGLNQSLRIGMLPRACIPNPHTLVSVKQDLPPRCCLDAEHVDVSRLKRSALQMMDPWIQPIALQVFQAPELESRECFVTLLLIPITHLSNSTFDTNRTSSEHTHATPHPPHVEL